MEVKIERCITPWKGSEKIFGRSRPEEQADEDAIVHTDVRAQPAVIVGSEESRDQ